MGTVKRTVSGCFRTERYVKAYCRISSYLQSMAYQGVNPLVAIQMALSGQLYAERSEQLRYKIIRRGRWRKSDIVDIADVDSTRGASGDFMRQDVQ